jgi:hypothetical protein
MVSRLRLPGVVQGGMSPMLLPLSAHAGIIVGVTWWFDRDVLGKKRATTSTGIALT